MEKSPFRIADFTSEPQWSCLEDFGASISSHIQHYDGLTDHIVSAHLPQSQSKQVAITRDEAHLSFESYPRYLDSDRPELHEENVPSSRISDATSMSRRSTASSSLSITSSCEADVLCCSAPGCHMTFTGRYRRGNWNRHKRQKHTDSGSQEYPCRVNGCGMIYLRPDARLKHYRKRHMDALHTGPPRARK